tara:strand:+ start:270 stop:455 length:186 start_codon:yes stop_codon:yes gene_type:complete
MKLEEAMYIVINEAEVSALGERTDENLRVLLATEVVQAFYDEHGHHFSNFSVDNTEETCHS